MTIFDEDAPGMVQLATVVRNHEMLWEHPSRDWVGSYRSPEALRAHIKYRRPDWNENQVQAEVELWHSEHVPRPVIPEDEAWNDEDWY